MKVLFVIRGKSNEIGIAPFILSQIESIKEQGIDVGYLPISGKGIKTLFIRQIGYRDL